MLATVGGWVGYVVILVMVILVIFDFGTSVICSL